MRLTNMKLLPILFLISFSVSGQLTWTAINNDGHDNRALDFTNPNDGWMIVEDTNFYFMSIEHTPDAGGTWVNQFTTGSKEYLTDIEMNESYGYASGGGEDIQFNTNWGFYLSTSNFGTNWDDYSRPYSCSAISFTTQDNFSTGGYDMNTGSNFWLSRHLGVDNESTINPHPFLCVEHANHDTVWAGSINGTILFSGDGGITWSGQIVGSQNIVRIHFIDSDNGWAIGEYGETLQTTDGGTTWSIGDVSLLDLNSKATSIVALSPDVVFVSQGEDTTTWSSNGVGKVFSTYDGGLTWNLEHTCSHPLLDIDYDGVHIWTCGYRGELWRSSQYVGITEIEISINVFPNPVQSSNSIKVECKAPIVRLELYNVSGQLIQSVDNSDNMRVDAVKGVYILQVVTGLGIATKKILVKA